jgi:hypothetical protein
MRRINDKLKAIMNQDPYMDKGCICGHDNRKNIEWHHAIIYRNRQVDERWAIVPTCHFCHEDELERLEYIALLRADVLDLSAINKARHFTKRIGYLSDKFKGEKYETKEGNTYNGDSVRNVSRII